LIKILYLFYFLSAGNVLADFPVILWLAVPADLNELILKPWTVITYMFLHESFMHILFNMLMLFWFGKIFLDYLDQKKLVVTYILGGLAGASASKPN